MTRRRWAAALALSLLFAGPSPARPQAAPVQSANPPIVRACAAVYPAEKLVVAIVVNSDDSFTGRAAQIAEMFLDE